MCMEEGLQKLFLEGVDEETLQRLTAAPHEQRRFSRNNTGATEAAPATKSAATTGKQASREEPQFWRIFAVLLHHTG